MLKRPRAGLSGGLIQEVLSPKVVLCNIFGFTVLEIDHGLPRPYHFIIYKSSRWNGVTLSSGISTYLLHNFWGKIVLITLFHDDWHLLTLLRIEYEGNTKFRECAVLWRAWSLEQWIRNPVSTVSWLYITMDDTWSSWQDNGNIMDPGQNIHHVATSELTDRHKMKFPSPGPHTWGYSTSSWLSAIVSSCFVLGESPIHL